MLKENGSFRIIDEFDMESFDLAWQDWFDSKHPFAVRVAEYFKKGIGEYLSIIGFVIEKILISS